MRSLVLRFRPRRLPPQESLAPAGRPGFLEGRPHLCPLVSASFGLVLLGFGGPVLSDHLGDCASCRGSRRARRDFGCRGAGLPLLSFPASAGLPLLACWVSLLLWPRPSLLSSPLRGCSAFGLPRRVGPHSEPLFLCPFQASWLSGPLCPGLRLGRLHAPRLEGVFWQGLLLLPCLCHFPVPDRLLSPGSQIPVPLRPPEMVSVTLQPRSCCYPRPLVNGKLPRISTKTSCSSGASRATHASPAAGSSSKAAA